MTLNIDNEKYEIIIEYKNNKNMYLRVKDDLKIYIYAPKRITNREITNFVNNNIQSISKMIRTMKNKRERLDNKLLYLGKYYDICYIDNKDLIFGESKAFISRKFNLDRWYKTKASEIFKERFNYWYNTFRENIPYPELKIRNMTSKWGVCNVTNCIVTLNLNLIKLDIKYLDYVIVHELSHLLQANHSNKFWNIVSQYIPNYKKLRSEMKNIL